MGMLQGWTQKGCRPEVQASEGRSKLAIEIESHSKKPKADIMLLSSGAEQRCGWWAWPGPWQGRQGHISDRGNGGIEGQ